MIAQEEQLQIDFTGCWWVCRFDTCAQERRIQDKSVDFTIEDNDLFALVEITDPGKPSIYAGHASPDTYTGALPANAPRPINIVSYFDSIITELVQKCKATCDNLHPVPMHGKHWRYWVLIGTDAYGRIPIAQFVHLTNKLEPAINKVCFDPHSLNPLISACVITNLACWNQKIKYIASRVP